MTSTNRDCVDVCQCYENVLDCSNTGMKNFPDMPTILKRKTVMIVLRNNPEINLSNVPFNTWKRLIAIDLTGNQTLILIY